MNPPNPGDNLLLSTAPHYPCKWPDVIILDALWVNFAVYGGRREHRSLRKFGLDCRRVLGLGSRAYQLLGSMSCSIYRQGVSARCCWDQTRFSPLNHDPTGPTNHIWAMNVSCHFVHIVPLTWTTSLPLLVIIWGASKVETAFRALASAFSSSKPGEAIGFAVTQPTEYGGKLLTAM